MTSLDGRNVEKSKHRTYVYAVEIVSRRIPLLLPVNLYSPVNDESLNTTDLLVRLSFILYWVSNYNSEPRRIEKHSGTGGEAIGGT